MYMQKIMLVPLLIASCGMLSSCDRFKSREETTVPSQYLLVNVLDKEQFDDAHIPGSIHVPYEQVEKWSVSVVDKKTPIVVYCANFMCTASVEAARLLKSLGFENVKAYEGGIVEWKHLGYPIEGPQKLEYLVQYSEPKDLEQPTDVSIVSGQELKKIWDEHFNKKLS
jgi:rhodanese-related sulfurtransferase